MALSIGAHGKGASAVAQTDLDSPLTTQATGSAFVMWLWYLSDGAGFNRIEDTINSVASGNSWQQAGSEFTAASGVKSRVYYVENGAGGANHQFSLFIDGGSIIAQQCVLEVKGAKLSSILNGTPARQSDTSSPYTSPNIVTTAQDTILLANCIGTDGSGGTWTFTAGNSFTKLDEISDSNNFFPGASMYRIVANSGTYATSTTISAGAVNDTTNWILAFESATSSTPNAPSVNDAVTLAESVTMHMPISLKMQKLS